MNSKTVAFHNFGCKVNFAETSSVSRQFLERGYTLVDFREKADIYVISTCVVTAVAEKKCRAAIRQVHHRNPEARIAVVGCFPELKPEEIAGMEGVDIVLGHSAKFGLLEAVENLYDKNRHTIGINAGKDDFISSYSYGDRTRSFLKIQDGCDYYCAYCTIPLARGHSRSDTIENVITHTHEIIRKGIKEIVLTGVNIGDFGHHNNETLGELLNSLERINDVSRIRISSIEPDLLTNEIIDFIAGSGKFMPHFHIPLQSGSDTVLKAMKRKYTTSLFASRVQKIRSVLPNACIASDIIVGFPGETDIDFEETLAFLQALDISYLHVFTYSKRNSTAASMMSNPVDDRIKKHRSVVLHHLSEQKKSDFYKSCKGLSSKVLFESDNSGGWMHGFTENYIKVKTKFNPAFSNEIISVTLDFMQEDNVYVIEEPTLRTAHES